MGNVDAELRTFKWYHGPLSRHAAEALLMVNGRDGSYLLRRREERDMSYALAVRSKDSVKHFQVEWTEKVGFSFGLSSFSTVKAFADHLANEPLLGSETGALVRVRFPYPREVAEPTFYDPVIVHTALKSGQSSDSISAHVPSLGSKEGFLTKLGNHVKTWKTRWFTLQRYELKYFKDRQDTHPIKTLDLTQCTGVQFDYSLQRVNCFCLVFSERTFYLCAKSALEADEWIRILRWKVVSVTIL
uniref:Dual adaptor of phosphotyrosine and 3-phosphoinositides 1 n=2 Tax=Eptatretus burgeri TaxID=7764 RepID=A0A8C4QHT0_EPTBU